MIRDIAMSGSASFRCEIAEGLFNFMLKSSGRGNDAGAGGG